MLYEAYMISEATAIALSGLSPNTFHTKSYEIETHPKDFALNFNLFGETCSTYEKILSAWMSFANSSLKIDFSSNDYIDSPKRYGNIPMTALENIQYEDAKKDAAESKKIFKKGLISSVIKMPEQNGFCNAFRYLDDDSFEELSKEELYQKLMELRLPIITPIDFKRYRKKLQLMDTKKRYRVITDNSPMEIAVTDYLNSISPDKRNTYDFITWLSNN